MSNLAKRLLTAGVLIPILVLFIWFLPPWVLMVPAGICIFAGSLEVMTMIGGRNASRPQQMLGAGLVTAACCGAITLALRGEGHWQVWMMGLGLSAAGLLLLGLAFYRPLETAAARLAGMLTALFYPGVLLSLLIMIHNNARGGEWWALCILTTAFFCDTGAYFAGRFLGKHPLSPTLSPKKTWEGVAGGLAGSLIATLAAHFIYLPDLPLADALLLGLAGSAAAVLGDLVESLIKRSTGIKDAGKFFPGHGGMMDRIDGLLFTIPVFYGYIYLSSLI
jgi:phosphatidate cytidylyltransferase